MTAVADEMPSRADVLAELKEVRRRGYTQLDVARTRPTRIDTPSLEYAAVKIMPPGYRANMTRMAIIKLLLEHEIAALGEPFSELLTISFGTRRGLDSSYPPALRRQAATLAKQAVETFKNDKEEVALGALADQIVADCLGEQQSNDAISADELSPDDENSLNVGKSGRRFRASWIYASIGFVVLIIVALIAIPSSNRKASPSHDGKELLRATVTATRSLPSFSVVFAQEQHDEAIRRVDRFQELTQNDVAEYHLELLNAGAFAAGKSAVTVELEALTDGEITVTDVRPINIERHSLPLDTLVRLDVGAGPPPPHLIRFSLDQATPTPMSNLAEAGVVITPFFEVQRIGVKPGQKETLALDFSAGVTATSFDVAVTFEHQGSMYTRVLHRTDEGLPFRVAPMLCNSGGPPAPLIGARRDEVEKVRSLTYSNVYKLDRDQSRPAGYLTPVLPDDFRRTC